MLDKTIKVSHLGFGPILKTDTSGVRVINFKSVTIFKTNAIFNLTNLYLYNNDLTQVCCIIK